MSESKEEEYKPENTGIGDLLKTVDKVYKVAYNKGIEDFKEALKKELKNQVSLNKALINSKDKRIFGYLQYANFGLTKAIELIDTVQPTEK